MRNTGWSYDILNGAGTDAAAQQMLLFSSLGRFGEFGFCSLLSSLHWECVDIRSFVVVSEALTFRFEGGFELPFLNRYSAPW
jgi:hypothetical protein